MTFMILFHAGNAVALFAFLFRDQFHLRVAVVVSMLLQAVYYRLSGEAEVTKEGRSLAVESGLFLGEMLYRT